MPTVVVPPESRREPVGITVIRDEMPADDVRLIGGLPTTGKARTVIDCLILLPEEAGRSFLDRALQQRWLTHEELVERSILMSGRPGVAKLRQQIRTASYGVRSEGERVMRRLLVDEGIHGWLADWPLPGVGVLDFAFPELRLALEIDGRAWHSAGERFQRDPPTFRRAGHDHRHAESAVPSLMIPTVVRCCAVDSPIQHGGRDLEGGGEVRGG
jgi:hypothetical protein